jgi:hypothetical protein
VIEAPACQKQKEEFFITNKLLKMEVLDSLGKRWLVFGHRKISDGKYLLRNEGRKEGTKDFIRLSQSKQKDVCVF